MFANLFAQLDDAMKQLAQHGSVYSVRSSGNTSISLFSSNGMAPGVVTVSADGTTITITSGG
jgi:hypothetical protein